MKIEMYVHWDLQLLLITYLSLFSKVVFWIWAKMNKILKHDENNII